MTALDRATGALYGLAIGDALGMPTQMMSRDAIVAKYDGISGFEAAAPDHPLAAGLPAGSVTDDTEQAVLLAHHLVAHTGRIDGAAFAAELVAWENDMRARGSLDLLGPSTKAAITALLAGTPLDEAGRYGTTNGAAMRVTPVGIVMSSNYIPDLVERVVEASRATHNTGVAIAGASAVAAAVSAGIDGASIFEATIVAIEAASLGSRRGHWVAAADVAARIQWVVTLHHQTAIYELVGTSLATQESVPAAFALLATYSDPWEAVCAAASLGGDSDTIAAMVGAVAGACGASWPSDAIDTVRSVNQLDLAPLAADLLALR
ncbi:MAG: ADP-ribosylglycohydrolase family protein [Rhodoglobus sp.]